MVQFVINANISGVELKSGTEFFKKLNPKNSRAKPIRSSPIDLFLFDFNIIKKNPNPIRGIASVEMSALNPRSVMSQAVNVVPILAPIITPIDCVRVSSPAFTKLTTITVVALED